MESRYGKYNIWNETDICKKWLLLEFLLTIHECYIVDENI